MDGGCAAYRLSCFGLLCEFLAGEAVMFTCFLLEKNYPNYSLVGWGVIMHPAQRRDVDRLACSIRHTRNALVDVKDMLEKLGGAQPLPRGDVLKCSIFLRPDWTVSNPGSVGSAPTQTRLLLVSFLAVGGAAGGRKP